MPEGEVDDYGNDVALMERLHEEWLEEHRTGVFTGDSITKNMAGGGGGVIATFVDDDKAEFVEGHKLLD